MHSDPIPADLDEVEELMARCLERPPAEWVAALQEAARSHPEHAQQLARRMRMLAMLDSRDGAEPVAIPMEHPKQLGDFTRMECLGSGGMGIVYRARQESLGRDVALKLIRPERLYFEGSLARFQREVETVARLKHTGIVSILSVGRVGKSGADLPYFAMELLDGLTLAQVVRSLHGLAPEGLSGQDLFEAVGGQGPATESFQGTWVEACLGVALQVARALEHAHDRGALHRDIKPSNVMLSPEGRAVLFDFGLTASRTLDESRVTLSGHPVGTLVYMAPEQLEGTTPLDGRADVYALGATLYELLALQVPFEGNAPLQIQRSILLGESDSLRGRNRRVSADAQVVVMKAMARRAGDRYSSAAEFSEDLGNLLARRPIRAQAPGPCRRAARWVQRRPTAAAAIGLAAVLLAGVPSFFLWVSHRHQSELRDSVSLERAAKQSALEANAELEDVVAFSLGMFSRADPRKNRGKVPDARKMLDLGATELSRLDQRPGSQARIHLALGELFGVVTDVRKAQPHFDAAIAFYSARDDETSRRRLASALRHSGHNLLFLRRVDEAETQIELALKIALTLHPEGSPELHAYHATLAELHADTHNAQGELAARRRTIEVLENGGPGPDNVPLARARGMLGLSLKSTGDLAAARPLLETALAWGRTHPNALGAEEQLFELTLADLEKLEGNFERAIELSRSAHTRLLETEGEDSLRTQQAEFGVAEIMARTGRSAEALPIFERLAVTMGRGFPPFHPAMLRTRTFQLACLEQLERARDIAPLCLAAGIPATFIEGRGLADLHTRNVIRALAMSHRLREEHELSRPVFRLLEEAERSAQAGSPRHADAVFMLIDERLAHDSGETLDAAGSEALLRELIESIGESPLPYESTTMGETLEAGHTARTLLATLLDLDPTHKAEAGALRAEADGRAKAHASARQRNAKAGAIGGG